MQREADELTVELVELKQQLHTAARFKWIEAEDDSDHQAKPSAFSCAESWQNSICWEKMMWKKIVGCSKLCMEFTRHLLLSHFLCFLHLQVQSQPLENTPRHLRWKIGGLVAAQRQLLRTPLRNGQVDGLDLKLFKIDWCDQESTQNQLIFRWF